MLFHIVVCCFLIWRSKTEATRSTPSIDKNNKDSNYEDKDNHFVVETVLPLVFVVMVGCLLLVVCLRETRCKVQSNQKSLTPVTGRTQPPPADDDGYLQVVDAGGGYLQVGQTLSQDQTYSSTDPTPARQPNVENETHHYSSIDDSPYTNDCVDSDQLYNNTSGPQQNLVKTSYNLNHILATYVSIGEKTVPISTNETTDSTNVYDTVNDNTYT